MLVLKLSWLQWWGILSRAWYDFYNGAWLCTSQRQKPRDADCNSFNVQQPEARWILQVWGILPYSAPFTVRNTLPNSRTWYMVWLEHRKFYLSIGRISSLGGCQAETLLTERYTKSNSVILWCDTSRPKVLVQATSINGTCRSVCLFKARFFFWFPVKYISPVPMTWS